MGTHRGTSSGGTGVPTRSKLTAVLLALLMLGAAASVPAVAATPGVSPSTFETSTVDRSPSGESTLDSATRENSVGDYTSSTNTVTDRTNVTLITGQTVTVIETATGREYRVDSEVPMRVVETSRATYVYPAGVDFERFDRSLFNIDLLLQQGLSDAETNSIPIIVKKQGARSPREASGPVRIDPLETAAGVSDRQSLDSIGAVAAWVDKGNAPAVAKQLGRSDQVASVHLDVKYEPTLDEVEDIVRAGTARQQYNVSGDGVNVSIIDSGINDSHPDIDGIVLDEDFSDDGTPNETEDKIGHGTHVAGIIAGDGTASNGTYVGVAPNVSLFDAKVFDEGGAYTSTIIDAMEWSVKRDADVVSMSLGGDPYYERSNDPYTDAVNYAVRNNVTVVVAAGNSGPDYETMQSPGIVKNAITVGASDKNGAITDFSSRGPTPYGKYVKPDVVAPGQYVVSACAEDSSYDGYCTGPNDAYVSLSGTSMATPVVSGIAALLEEKYGWGPLREKNVITSTADPLGSQDVYTQGAGRVDAVDALSADLVVRNATTDFGELPGQSTASRTITITNIGDESRTVSLSANATRISDGGHGNVELNRTSLTLAPGESASVQLSVTTDTGNGTYSGWVSIGSNYTAIFGYNTSYTASDVNASGKLVTSDGTAAAGDEVYAGTSGGVDNITDSAGRFNVSVPPEDPTRLSYVQTPDTADGTADVWLFAEVNLSQSMDLGELTAPAGHNLTVTVVNESGSPVENATVTVADHNATLDANSTTLTFETGSDGNVSGLELAGAAVVTVTPPSGGSFVDTTYVREPTVTDDMTITVTLNESQEPPTAALSANQTTITTGETIAFDASGSSDDSGIVEYRWDFDGDGKIDQTTTSATTEYTYTSAGTYAATVTVVDGDGATDTATVDVTVEEPNDAPTAALSANRTTVEPDGRIALDASGSSDDSGIVEYRWDFDGDGSVDRTTTSATVEHAYSTTGTYTVRVTVVDADGATDTATVDVSVESDTPPEAALTADPSTVPVNDSVTLDASGSSDDDDLVEYRWDFDGDGKIDRTTTSATVEYTYTSVGTYTVTVTVVDADNSSDTATVDVTVEEPNDAPTAALSANQTTITTGETIAFDASGSSDDSGIVEYRWDFDGDGSVDRTTTSATVEYTYTSAGTYGATVTVVDPQSETATASLQTTVRAGDDGSGDGDDSNSGGENAGGQSGGGGGQGSSPENDVDVTEVSDGVTVRLDDLGYGATVSADLHGKVDGEGVAFTQARVDLLFDNRDFRVEFSDVRATPERAPELPEATALGYLSIEAYGLDMENVDTITLRFTVDQTALPDDASPERVTLYRYHDGNWQALDTTHVGNDTYEATVPGFSEFAIGVASTAGDTTETPATTEPDTRTRSEMASQPATPRTDSASSQPDTVTTPPSGSTDIAGAGFGAVVAFLAVVTAALLARRRN